jgi:hypothetical protein
MANGVKRFQTHGRQFQPIQREVGGPELEARALLSLHARATAARHAPQAPNNHFIKTGASGIPAGGSQRIRGGTSNPVSNSKFI